MGEKCVVVFKEVDEPTEKNLKEIKRVDEVNVQKRKKEENFSRRIVR